MMAFFKDFFRKSKELSPAEECQILDTLLNHDKQIEELTKENEMLRYRVDSQNQALISLHSDLHICQNACSDLTESAKKYIESQKPDKKQERTRPSMLEAVLKKNKKKEEAKKQSIVGHIPECMD